MKKYVAEFIGTFVLVFFGTGIAVVSNGNLVATALAYDDNTDVENDLTTLKVIATRYNSTELLEILNAIEDVYNSKFSLDQASFESSAEQVWDRYISFLLEE